MKRGRRRRSLSLSRSRLQGMRMAVGSVKMQPPCESPALAAAAAVAAADGAFRRSPSAREPEREPLQVPPRPRLRDLPALLRSGLTLRRKRSAAGGRVSGRVLPAGMGVGGAHVEPAPTLAGDRGGRLEVGEVPGGAPL